MIIKQLNVFVLICVICGLLLTPVQAGQPAIWETSGRVELLRGDARGVSISDTGVLMLSPKLTEVFNTQQTYVWSSAVDNQGNVYLGTGHDGKIFKVSSAGSGSLLYDAAELDVTALAIARDGAIYAGTSPDGKVYRITPDGKADVYFDPGDKYIWSLATDRSGNVFAATGDKGVIYKITPDGKGRPFYRTNTTNVVTLVFDREGHLLAGTESPGRIYRIDPAGKAFVLLDSPYREIHAISSSSP